MAATAAYLAENRPISTSCKIRLDRPCGNDSEVGPLGWRHGHGPALQNVVGQIEAVTLTPRLAFVKDPLAGMA